MVKYEHKEMVRQICKEWEQVSPYIARSMTDILGVFEIDLILVEILIYLFFLLLCHKEEHFWELGIHP